MKNRSRLNILLIEDQLPQVELLRLFLEGQSYFAVQIQVASNLVQGLQQIQRAFFDIVLLDLFLPDSMGIDGLEKLKRFVPHIPVIVLTSGHDLSLGLEAIQKGAEDYLVKGQLEESHITRAIIYAQERQKIKRKLQQQIEREQLMGRILEEIRQSLDLSIILQTTVDEVRKFLQVDRVLIYRAYSKTMGRVLVESPGKLSKSQLKRRQSMIRSLHYFLNTHRVAKAEPANSLLSMTPELEGFLTCLTDAVLTVPIWQHLPDHRNRLWGQLIAQDLQGTRQWQGWEVEFLQHLSSQVAIAIQQSELFSQVHQQATLDGLTGLANRRHFNHVLQQQWQQQGKKRQYLSLVLCDIDFFKQYNDTYGHLQGDECLRQVAKLLQQVARRDRDLVARYGGEEFALILPRTNLPGCNKLIHQLQKNYLAAKIPHQGSAVSPYLTLSMGSATIIPTPHSSPEKLIKMADSALYEAKHLGRNRHVSASAISLTPHLD